MNVNIIIWCPNCESTNVEFKYVNVLDFSKADTCGLTTVCSDCGNTFSSSFRFNCFQDELSYTDENGVIWKEGDKGCSRTYDNKNSKINAEIVNHLGVLKVLWWRNSDESPQFGDINSIEKFDLIKE